MYAAIMYIHIQSCLVFTTPPPPKKTDPLQLSSFHHKSGSLQTLRSSPSIWRDWLQSRVTPTVGKQCSKNGKASMGGKSSQTEDLWFGRRKKIAELKFHRPTRHSLRVEKTQLLDVTVEGDIRKLISWIHVTHMCRYWIFNKYSCEATSKGCQSNLNKWRIDTLWELNHLAPSRYVSSIDYIEILYTSKQMMKVATKIHSIFQKLQPSCGWL